jgi:hypothetical protein
MGHVVGMETLTLLHENIKRSYQHILFDKYRALALLLFAFIGYLLMTGR